MQFSFITSAHPKPLFNHHLNPKQTQQQANFNANNVGKHFIIINESATHNINNTTHILNLN